MKQSCTKFIPGETMPCLADIAVFAGLEPPCEVCAPSLNGMRNVMGWEPVGNFFMSENITGDQREMLLKEIEARP